ncbi:hypothetical protein [Allopontixanthobacter sediminis]|uniref:Uncharacterized protein n=1 Tax=Allopontixanthobacter sediminis TaxID=1689985 RepID=A0A845B467_9SPHN|nr:hypothetical protein [Allopontixanthobacter sediminis]MXP44976.1 hypothetical protein [Allopontixanthobacter sediminis]
MVNEPIDTWNVKSFDPALLADFAANADLIRDYLETFRRQSREREASTRLMAYPENPLAGDYLALKERLMGIMASRTIRAWHYTRMTDDEVQLVRQNGVHLSTLETTRARFARQVAAGHITEEVADRLFADSPFQGDQLSARAGKFWMVSNPVLTTSSGVKPLLASWGGEAAHFWQQDSELKLILTTIGLPRVLEIAMPLAHSRHSYRAAEAVVATYARTLGCRPDGGSFDLYSQCALGPETILDVHSEGDESFTQFARGYPPGYMTVDANGDDD